MAAIFFLYKNRNFVPSFILTSTLSLNCHCHRTLKTFLIFQILQRPGFLIMFPSTFFFLFPDPIVFLALVFFFFPLITFYELRLYIETEIYINTPIQNMSVECRCTYILCHNITLIKPITILQLKWFYASTIQASILFSFLLFLSFVSRFVFSFFKVNCISSISFRNMGVTTDWLIFNGMLTCLGLIYSWRLGNCIYWTFIFLCSCFLRGFFHMVLLNMNISKQL